METQFLNISRQEDLLANRFCLLCGVTVDPIKGIYVEGSCTFGMISNIESIHRIYGEGVHDMVEVRGIV